MKMFSPIVLIPSYNSGALLESTVRGALANTEYPVWVVVDGSTDGSEGAVELMALDELRLNVIVKILNEGKGAAVRTGLKEASQQGFTHALVMDADGQHPEQDIERFLGHAKEAPGAMILGQPVFDDNVPLERLYGRKLSVWVVQFEIMSRKIGDPLYGFRVYPIEKLLQVMANPSRSNRYDFDPEVAVRLCWAGVQTVKVKAPVKYIDREQGGVSHFQYVRDNVRFVVLHVRLVIEAPFRWLLKAFFPEQ